MDRCLVKGVIAAANVQKRQSANITDTQSNVQIPQTHIAINAKHSAAIFGKCGGNTGAKRGFSCAALTGQNADQFSHAYRLLAQIKFIIKQ
jgi:hypothetical protein